MSGIRYIWREYFGGSGYKDRTLAITTAPRNEPDGGNSHIILNRKDVYVSPHTIWPARAREAAMFTLLLLKR